MKMETKNTLCKNPKKEMHHSIITRVNSQRHPTYINSYNEYNLPKNKINTTLNIPTPTASVIHLIVICSLLGWNCVKSYGTGAPHRSCDTLEPEHYGTFPQDHEAAPFPYRVEVLDGGGFFSPGQYIRIRISGFIFRGFILQVRDEIGRSRGKFVQVPQEAKTLTCRHDDDTITHSSPLVKENIVLVWRAPDNDRIKKLSILGTIARSESIYWTGVYIPLHSSLHTEL